MLNTYKTKLVEKKQLTSDVYWFKFQLQNNQRLDFSAGQYVILSVPQSQGGDIKRLYSLASSSVTKDSFEIIVKILPGGKAGTYLNNLSISDEVIFTGPAGLFTFHPKNNPVVFLATGTGIAPILSALRTFTDTTISSIINETYLYWGLPKITDVYLLDELKRIKQVLPNFKFQICLSRESSLGRVSSIDQCYFSLGRINTAFKQIESADYYVCGSSLVVESLKNELLQKGVKLENIHFEKFSA